MSLSGLHMPPRAHVLPTVNIIYTHTPPLHHLTHTPKKKELPIDSNNTLPKNKETNNKKE